MHADDVLGPLRRACQRRDEDRGGVRGDHDVAAADLRQPAEQLALQIRPLGRGLDHELRVAQLGELARGPQPFPGGARVVLAPAPALGALAQALLDPHPAGLERLRERVVEHGVHPGEHPELGDPGAHRPGADHAEPARCRAHEPAAIARGTAGAASR